MSTTNKKNIMHPNVLMCFVNDDIYESKQVYSTKNNYLYNDESFHYSIDELYEQYDFGRDTNQKKRSTLQYLNVSRRMEKLVLNVKDPLMYSIICIKSSY